MRNRSLGRYETFKASPDSAALTMVTKRHTRWRMSVDMPRNFAHVHQSDAWHSILCAVAGCEDSRAQARACLLFRGTLFPAPYCSTGSGLSKNICLKSSVR